jgi:hypothetical protein
MKLKLSTVVILERSGSFAKANGLRSRKTPTRVNDD